jgi:hypothetical protein
MGHRVNQSIEPILRLERFRTYLRAKPSLTPDERDVLSAFDRYFNGEAISVAFDLKRCHGDPRDELKRHRSYELIKKLARKHFDGSTINEQAARIERAMLRYFEFWQGERWLEHCPPRRRGTIESDHWDVFSLHPRPLKERRLRQILTDMRRAPPSREG